MRNKTVAPYAIPYRDEQVMSLQNVSLCVPRASSGLDPTQPVIAVSPHSPHEIPPNHVVIRVDRFGFSANNVTYQALGEAPNFRYVSALLARIFVDLTYPAELATSSSTTCRKLKDLLARSMA